MSKNSGSFKKMFESFLQQSAILCIFGSVLPIFKFHGDPVNFEIIQKGLHFR